MSDSVRRIVTTRIDGRSIVAVDDVIPLAKFPGIDASGAVIWTTGQVPADNTSDVNGALRGAGMALKGGSVLRVTEFGPGFATPMHRTLSLDYVVVLAGSLDMDLDSGGSVSLKRGDVVVQRGGTHRWCNRSSAVARILIVMIEALPFSTATGRSLSPTPEWLMFAASFFISLKAKLSRPTLKAPFVADASCRPYSYVIGYDPTDATVIQRIGNLLPPNTENKISDILVWANRRFPITNSIVETLPDREIYPAFQGGTKLWIVVIKPNTTTPATITASIDYAVVLFGDVELLIDGEDSVRVGSGETIIQRGCQHGWRNPSLSVPCRLWICMIQSGNST